MERKPTRGQIGRRILYAAILLVLLVAGFLYFSTSIDNSPVDERLPAPEQIEKPDQKRVLPLQLPGQSKREPIAPSPSPKSISFIKQAVATENEPTIEPDTPVVAEIQEQGPEFHTLTYEIKNGDSLATIFKKHDLSANLLHRIVHSSDTAKKLTDIRPGEVLYVDLDHEQNFLGLRLEQSKINSLKITAVDDGFESVELSREVEVRTNHISGTIESSFYGAAKEAGLSEKTDHADGGHLWLGYRLRAGDPQR